MSIQVPQAEADLSRLTRLEPLVAARLGEIGPLLAQTGMKAAYVPPQLVCDLGAAGRAPDRPASRSIPLEIDGVSAGTIEVVSQDAEPVAMAFLERLAQSWCQEWAAELREQALLEELSSSWESLEALYEVSSSLRLSNSPEVLLDSLLGRATTIAPDLAAAIWLFEQDETLRATVRNAPPLEPMKACGPLARCIASRDSLLLNRRSAILEMTDLPEYLRGAYQLAAAPIITSEGLKGVLELWASRPGTEFTTHLLRLIEALAHQAGLVMDNDRLNRAFVESTRIRRDIEIGSSIQQTLLFGRAPQDFPGITVAAISRPSQTVDGDFYDFMPWRDESLDVVVGDVMGKGIPAALLGAATKSAFLRAMATLSSESQAAGITSVLRSVHGDMVPDLLRLESFISLCYARFNLNDRTVTFVDCGHPRSIHYRRRQGDCVFLEGGSLPLGFSPSASYEPYAEPFAPGDLFVFYSDGISEAASETGEFFGSDRLAAVVAANAALAAAEILQAVERAVLQFAATESLADDFTCVIVEIGRELPIHLARCDWNASLENAAAAREWVVGQVRRVFPGVADELVYWSMELAAAETFTNIVEHAYGGDGSRLVRIELQFYADRLTMRFVHWGKDFDPEAIPAPSFDGSRDRGFGLYLIANTMDSVQYHQQGASGQVISMEKRFPRPVE